MSWPRQFGRASALAFLAIGAIPDATEARPLEKVMRTAELRVCIAPIHPTIAVAEPPGCNTSCEFHGPARDTVLAFAATLGDEITVRFRRIDWDQQFQDESGQTVRPAEYMPALLANETCDLYPSNLTRNVWREKKLDFVTLFTNRMMVVVNKAEAAQYEQLGSLAGRVAAIEKDTSFHTWLQQQNAGPFADSPVDIKLQPMMSGIEAVNSARVDFTMMDSDAAIWSTRNQFSNAVVAFPVGKADEIGWAFRKSDKGLQAAVRGFFAAQKGDPNSEINRIWKRALGISLTRFESIVQATP